MRLSRYAIVQRWGELDYVYSGLSGALVQISESAREAIAAGDFSRLSGESLDALRQAYVLLPSELDEMALLEQRYLTGKASRTHLGLTVITSLGCNFDCPYCYEAKDLSLIKPEVSAALLSYVRGRIPELRSLQMHWLGGEPLMARTQLVELSSQFRALAESAGVVYFANITTNGFLLDRTTAGKLYASGITHAQVCLDGPPEVHDVMRPHVSGAGTFARILANIEASVDILDITIRVNLDTQNVHRAGELLDLLAARGLHEKVTIYAGQLVQVDDHAPQPTPSAGYGTGCFSGPEFAEVESAFLRAAASRGFNRPALPGPILTPCTAVRDDEHVIGSDGELYKCWENVGNKRCTVGTVFDLPGARAPEWEGYSPFKDDECLNCVALPSCMGGCLHHLKDARLRDSRCSTFRHNHVAQIETYIRQKTEGKPATATLPKPKTENPAPVRKLLPLTVVDRSSS